MASGTKFILNLTTREIRGALIKNGEVVQAESCGFDSLVTWTDAWDDGLRPFDQALRQLVSRFSKKSSWHTTLIYQSPSAVVQFDEINGTKQSVTDQAEAKIREMVGINGCVSSKVYESGSKKSGEAYSCLTIADHDATTRKLFAWMTRCGMRTNKMIPAGSVMMSHAIEESLRQPESTAVCYMGEEASVISYAIDGEIKLVRSIEIGYRHLSDGFTGALGLHDSEMNQSPEIKELLSGNRRVSDLIWEYGVPISGNSGSGLLLRREVLPRIAPILQRYSVEIKQTFRFGLSGGDMPSKLMLCGSGAMIPHISTAITQNCDMHIDTVGGVETFEPFKPFGVGTLERQFADMRGAFPSILPKVARESNQRRSCDRAIAAGIALAFGIMAIEAGSVHMQTRTIQEEIKGDAALVQAIETEKNVRAETIMHASAVDQIATVFTDNFGRRARWSEGFEAISSSMLKSIRIDQIQGQSSNGESVIELTGLAIGSSDANPTEMLNRFVIALRAQESVLDVRLGATSKRTSSKGKPAVQFELSMPIDSDAAPLYEYTSLANHSGDEGNP